MSCCTCGNCCQPGYGCLCQIVLPDNPVVQLTFENVNLLGIGVLDGTNGTNIEFRGIYSGNSSIVIALDAGNNAISITLNIDQIIDDLPQATTVQRGVGKTATDAEAIAKASITTFLTPSNLAALGASTVFIGLIEIATNAEAIAGASAVLAITPASLAAVVATLEQTTVWADAVARVAAVPAFAGQMGTQLDVDVVYVSTGVVAGDFNRPLLTFGSTNNISAITTSITTDGTTVLTFTGGGDIHFNGPNVLYSGGITEFGASALQVVNFADASLRIGGVVVPDESVLTTTNVGNGDPGSKLIDQFLSTDNTQTGYTNFTNSATLRTGDCNTLTLPQICQIVDTLIRDLKALQLPAV